MLKLRKQVGKETNLISRRGIREDFQVKVIANMSSYAKEGGRTMGEGIGGQRTLLSEGIASVEARKSVFGRGANILVFYSIRCDGRIWKR